MIKDLGIGTAATRASIIATLFKRNYIERSGKYIIPTEKGLYIYTSVRDMKVTDFELRRLGEKPERYGKRYHVTGNVYEFNKHIH